MNTFKGFESILYDTNGKSFTDIALALFRFQASNNKVYRQYLDNLSINPAEISSVGDIPFLPISLFKNNIIHTGEWEPEISFQSSGTTAALQGRHDVYSLKHYLGNARRCFEAFFGAIDQYHILALLPSYLERSNSSLVAMVDHLIKCSRSDYAGFYLHDKERLVSDIARLKKEGGKRILLWGVTFALLELAEQYRPDLSGCLVVETGGMKGRRKEITREELHNTLKNSLKTEIIYSEYGMTELFSQAYTRGGNRFFCPNTMQVIAREVTDPFQKGIIAETGGLNVIDLANIHSIAFIETEDLGKVFSDGSFEVLGRMDNSDIRGCNLLGG